MVLQMHLNSVPIYLEKATVPIYEKVNFLSMSLATLKLCRTPIYKESPRYGFLSWTERKEAMEGTFQKDWYSDQSPLNCKYYICWCCEGSIGLLNCKIFLKDVSHYNDLRTKMANVIPISKLKKTFRNVNCFSDFLIKFWIQNGNR